MKKILSLALASACLLLSGCGSGGSIYSNYRQTEHLQLVQALGADIWEEGDGVTLSVSCAKPAKNASGGIITRSGESILRAMSSLQKYSADQQLYYSHAEYVILGEDYARSDATTLFDFIARDNQLRLGLYLFVAKGGEAKDLVTGPGEESYEISKTLSSIRRDTEAQGASHVFTARETLRDLSENGAALVCALSPRDTKDNVYLLEPGITAVAEGYGILKDGLLVGFVEPEISQAANLIMGNLGSSGLSLPDGRGGRLSLEYEGGSAKIKPRWAPDGSLEAIDIEAKLKANLAEPDTEIENVTDKKLLSTLEKGLGEDMENKLRELLELCREHNADFLGLKCHLRSSDGEKAAMLGDDWLEKARFSVSCKAEISYTRELGDRMSAKGGK